MHSQRDGSTCARSGEPRSTAGVPAEIPRLELVPRTKRRCCSPRFRAGADPRGPGGCGGRGDLDPAVVFYLHREARAVDRRHRRPAQQAQRHPGAGRGQRHARGRAAGRRRRPGAAVKALDVYCHRIRKYVGGPGRPRVTLGPTRNRARSGLPGRSRPTTAPVTVLVVPTNEELEIAEHPRGGRRLRRPPGLAQSFAQVAHVHPLNLWSPVH